MLRICKQTVCFWQGDSEIEWNEAQRRLNEVKYPKDATVRLIKARNKSIEYRPDFRVLTLIFINCELAIDLQDNRNLISQFQPDSQASKVPLAGSRVEDGMNYSRSPACKSPMPALQTSKRDSSFNRHH